MTPEKLYNLIGKFRCGELTNEEIFADGGQGCFIASRNLSGFRLVGVTGPRRYLAQGLGYHPVNPYGDMMLTGCYGLVEAMKTIKQR